MHHKAFHTRLVAYLLTSLIKSDKLEAKLEPGSGIDVHHGDDDNMTKNDEPWNHNNGPLRHQHGHLKESAKFLDACKSQQKSQQNSRIHARVSKRVSKILKCLQE
jgi:hypothetical protein